MTKPKDFYTYVTNILHINTSDASYKGLRIIPSMSAMRELMKHGKTLADAADVLEEGYDAPRKRARGKVEKWLDRGRKTYNAVAAKARHDREDVWILIHFGRFTRRK
ncbi:MAG: hypothetical protein R6U32_03875 [Candidatus Woesearchaeota archaeon]